MISALQKIASGALFSSASTTKPKLLERPSSIISSQSNDPATIPPAAHMPHSRSDTSPHTTKKRQKLGKAREFVERHFSSEGDKDDPIETSPPPGTQKWRIPPSRGMVQDPSSNSTRPPDSDAVLIPVPGSTTPSQNSSSFTMRTSSAFRPVNTLDNTKSTQVYSGSRNQFQELHRGRSGYAGIKHRTPNPKTSHPTRSGSGEPPFKRQRTEASSTPYVRNEGKGVVSPVFKSAADGELIMVKSRQVNAPVERQSKHIKTSEPLSLALNEYQIVEETMQSGPPNRISQSERSPHFSSKHPNGSGDRSEDSDPERFTRGSKKARYQRRADEASGHPPELSEITGDSYETQDERPTPPLISEIFGPFAASSNKKHRIQEETELSATLPKLDSDADHLHAQFRRGPDKVSDSTITEIKRRGPRTAAKSAAGKQCKTNLKNPSPAVARFPLRDLKYGILPTEGSYVVEISDDLLSIYDTKAQLSKDPAWNPTQLKKILKIYHGSDECLQLMLSMSQCQGQPFNKMLLELDSRDDKEDFLSLMPKLPHKTLKVLKDNEHMRKCFERKPEVIPGNQQGRLGDVREQPISSQRQLPATTSPHFQNQRSSLAHKNARHPKLIDQLQTSTSPAVTLGADSRIPTIITGRDRANRVSTTSTHEKAAAHTTKQNSGQAQPQNSSRLRSSSARVPATRSSLIAGMSTNDSEEESPRGKYSEVYGLGEPWKTPLMYPKTGKRRMAVEFGDLFRLDEDEFLNDNLIAFFLRYLEYHLEQTKPELAERVYFYNSYFFERLTQSSRGKKSIDYESVQKWTRNVDIFDRDFVVVPVNESFHWYVVIICNLSKLNPGVENESEQDEAEAPTAEKSAIASKERLGETVAGGTTKEAHDQPTEKTTESMSYLSLSDHEKDLDELAPSSNTFSPISSPKPASTPRKSGPGRRKGARHSLPKYNVSAPIIMTLDSLDVARSSTCTALRQYIVEEAKNKKGWDLDGSLIKGMTAKGIPTQHNYSDCGLYLCAYLEKFILDPAGFVGKILQREMDPNVDMPMMASEALRSRMRGFIRELHHEQEGEATEFPIPDVGRILIAPPREVSPDEVANAPCTPLQEESEDELQQDETASSVCKPARGPSSTTRAPSNEPAKNPTSSNIRLPKRPSPSKSSLVVAEMIAKVNASKPKINPNSGTRETAITIDDDEDPQPTTQSVPKKKNPISKDDFFDHPSELRVTRSRTPASSKKGPPLRSAVDVSPDPLFPQPPPRSRSSASADTVNTDFLSGGGNQSYRREGQEATQVPSARGRVPCQEITVVVPDSQESGPKEVAVKRDGGLEEGIWGRGEDEPQEILEGVE